MQKWTIRFKTWLVFIIGEKNWFTCHKYSQPMRRRHSQDKNWGQCVAFYWTPPEPHDFGDEGNQTRRWINYYAGDEIVQLGLNRGVWSVIDNQPIAWSGTEVRYDWWCVQGLVTTPPFFLDWGPTKDKGPVRQNNHEDDGSNTQCMKSSIITLG
jgi:hypothetical protein